MTTFSITTTLIATAATVAVDTTTASPPATWAFASGSAAIPTTAPAADWIVIEFSLGASVGLWVCSTGALVGSNNAGTGVSTITAGGPSCLFLPPGQSQPTTVMNLQPAPNWNIKTGVPTYYSGFDGAKDQSLSVALTAQSGFSGTHTNTHWQFGPNFLALIPSASATGTVTITFQ